MPNSTPANSPAPNVPSRSNSLTPRIHAIDRITSNAPAERIAACVNGGISGITSLIATWLKPQLRHNSSIKRDGAGAERTARRRDPLLEMKTSTLVAGLAPVALFVVTKPSGSARRCR